MSAKYADQHYQHTGHTIKRLQCQKGRIITIDYICEDCDFRTGAQKTIEEIQLSDICRSRVDMFLHDEKKIEEYTMYDLRGDWATEESKKDILEQLNSKLEIKAKKYAEHMIQQERERVVVILKEKMTAKNSYNMTYRELIKAINQE